MEKSISLHYKDGSSDKVYNVFLKEAHGATGYTVDFTYGRRGACLTAGTKTSNPVSLEQAEKTFDKLVKEKMSKGYLISFAPDKQTAVQSVNNTLNQIGTKVDSGIRPQLLNPIDYEELERYFKDSNYSMQEKKDGRRLIIKKEGKTATGINRKGEVIPLLSEFENEITSLDHNMVLDGEHVGNTFWCFDILNLNGVDLRNTPYQSRLAKLNRLNLDFKFIKVVETASTEKDKRDFFSRYSQNGLEGVVFKNIHSLYVAGRPNSGGNQLKFKFTTSATCRVVSQNGDKRSVSLEVMDGKRVVEVGNVTIPVNFTIPKPGELVEVRYLYAYKGGSLYQPVYLGVRDDIDHPDHILSLKLKAENAEDE